MIRKTPFLYSITHYYKQVHIESKNLTKKYRHYKACNVFFSYSTVKLPARTTRSTLVQKGVRFSFGILPPPDLSDGPAAILFNIIKRIPDLGAKVKVLQSGGTARQGRKIFFHGAGNLLTCPLVCVIVPSLTVGK